MSSEEMIVDYRPKYTHFAKIVRSLSHRILHRRKLCVGIHHYYKSVFGRLRKMPHGDQVSLEERAVVLVLAEEGRSAYWSCP